MRYCTLSYSIKVILSLSVFIVILTGWTFTAWAQNQEADREIIVKFKSGTIQLPDIRIEATVSELIFTTPAVRNTLEQLNTERVAKTFPGFQSADTVRGYQDRRKG